MNEVCIESFVYRSLEACVNVQLNTALLAHIEAYSSKEHKGSINKSLYLPLYTSGKVYVQKQIKILKEGLYILPLHSEGYGYTSPIDIKDKSCGTLVNKNKLKRLGELKKYMDLLEKFPPLLITKDLNILWDNHRPFIPEIGDFFPIGKISTSNHNKQDKIVFKILAVSRACDIAYIRGNWLVTLVEFEGKKTLLLFNSPWNRIQSYPYRYVLDKSLYRQMIKYIISLFEETPCSTNLSGTFSRECYTIQPHYQTYLNVQDCFNSKWEKQCLTPFDSPSTTDSLIEDIDKFISIYSK